MDKVLELMKEVVENNGDANKCNCNDISCDECPLRENQCTCVDDYKYNIELAQKYIAEHEPQEKTFSGKDKSIIHLEICNELNEIYKIKNHDYGDSFSETFKKLGLISAITRITDKVNRLQSLVTKENQVKDENIQDTLLDLANYSIMTIIELIERNNNEA